MSVSTNFSTKGIIGLSVCNSFRNLERREIAFFSASVPFSPCFSKNSFLCRCNVSIALVRICGILSLIVRYANDLQPGRARKLVRLARPSSFPSESPGCGNVSQTVQSPGRISLYFIKNTSVPKTCPSNIKATERI